MKNRQTVDRMIAKFGRSFGRPGLALNHDGALTVKADDIWFAFNWDWWQEALHIRVHAGDISKASNQSEILEAALMANRYFDGVAGGSLGLFGQDLVISYRIDFPLVNGLRSLGGRSALKLKGREEEAQGAEEDSDSFLIELLPRLVEAASFFLSECGAKAPRAIEFDRQKVSRSVH